MKIEFVPSGWVIDVTTTAPVAFCEKNGTMVEVDRDGDVEVSRHSDFEGQVSIYVPVIVLERLLEEHRVWQSRQPS